MIHQDDNHQRRVRYTGTHPKNYQDKYKEHEPEKFPEIVEKVLQKGSTPAGMHRSICVDEILELLQILPGQVGLDATLGYGGHALEMLKCLNSKGHLYAIDVDPIELPKTQARLENLGYGPEILSIRQMNFSGINQIVAASGPLDFILADLGVSSMQIDNPQRGFSFKTEGPLELRLNPKQGISVAERLKTISKHELEELLRENADEPNAKAIAGAIVSDIQRGAEIATTSQLQQIIKRTVQSIHGSNGNDEVKKTCQRCFQALRIDANNELGVLNEFLERLPNALAVGGRVAILTFHSGEDRLVKKSFQRLFRDGIYSEIADEPIRATAEERNQNGRARSAKLRWAKKA